VPGWTRRPLLRRLVTVPAMGAATTVLVVALPFTLLVALAADLLAGPRWRWRRARLVLLVTGLVSVESIGIMRSASSWVRAGFGRRLAGAASQADHHALERWWTDSHRRLLGWFAGMRLEVVGADGATPGPVIAICRHTSHADAALPAWILAVDRGLRLRYVLKQDLQWGPCLDIVGNRLPNHFVDRDPRDPSAELDAIRDLVAGLGDAESAVIFPEGTFPTAARRRRALERIARQDPGRAERLAGLLVLLPPRPGGTLALLDGAPDADVLMIAHVGFERLSELRQIARGLPFDAPVEVRIERIPRSEVPEDHDDRLRWLDEQWLRMDGWVADRLVPVPATDAEPAPTTGGGPRP
jgi:1-acyl-sn-glycerol-3-phosphate acyltransferase